MEHTQLTELDIDTIVRRHFINVANQDAKGLVAQIQKLSLAIKSKQLEDRFHETTDPKELAFALPRDDQGPPSFPVNLAMPWGTETWVTRLADYSSDLFCCRYSVADSWDDQKSPPQARRDITCYGHEWKTYKNGFVTSRAEMRG